MSHSSEISDEFLAQLKNDLVCRRIGCGMARLEEHRHVLSAFDPRGKNAGLFCGYVAQWVDVGFRRPRLVRDLIASFSTSMRAALPLHNYMHLRMAEGMVAMAEESQEEAIHHFDFVLSLERETDDKELLAIANFWKGRCLRMRGDYDQALAFAVKGRDLALELGHPLMAAVMRVLESWLIFQKGDAKQATEILQHAEAVLAPTDDYLTLGNIHSSYGRIARRQGRYQHAVESFSAALEQYRKRDPYYRNVARSLNNMAYVKRLMAQQLRRKIDADAARRRKAAAHGRADDSQGKLTYRKRFVQLRQEALAELAEAAAIYEQYEHHHGMGSVHLNYGYLYLDNGDLGDAEAAGKTAFSLGEQRRDYILMARAKLLSCTIANTRVEEGIGESDPDCDARLALDYAQEAVEFAKHTQNRRLLAYAHLWEGLTYCNLFFHDPDAARRCYDQAIALSRSDHSERTWADLELLKTKVLRSAKVNPTLRAWSQGAVGNSTFQQINQEFSEMIISKVWEREGRRVSRVATRLSISPKKVRRILDRLGRRKSDSD